MPRVKAYLTMLRTGITVRTKRGGRELVTPEVLRELARRNGWSVGPLAGDPQELRAYIEVGLSIGGANA